MHSPATLPHGLSPASPVARYLKHLHDKFARLDDGTVATYIPELGRANPDWFGIAIATMDGQVYEVGDSRRPFTIQSISKPLVYGMALEACGLKRVLEKVGVEPSGEAFNSISLDPISGRPLNPMINAGAIATASLIPGDTPEARHTHVLDTFGAFAAQLLQLDEAVYRSESETGHRNRAIAHLLRNFGILTGNPEEPLDLYFRQCAIAVTCRDLAVMAATLANAGVNPVTSRQVLHAHNVGRLLTLMSSCGMYDYAGEWMYRVGMPAKSGVSGAILAVLPGQLGVGVFSPRLDPKGNSVRGIRVCTEISNDFGLHLFNTPRVVTGAIRGSYTAAGVRSKRQRSSIELQVLQQRGDAVHLFDLRGRLGFASMELALREVLAKSQLASHVILDLERVVDLDDAACRLLLGLHEQLGKSGKRAHLTGIHDKPALRRYVGVHFDDGAWERLCRLRDRDEALEECENAVLIKAGMRVPPGEELPLERQELCKGLTPEEVRQLEKRLHCTDFPQGAPMIASGAPADTMCFIARGEVGVFLTAENASERLVLRLGPGMSVGELALVDRQPRSAAVRALTAVKAWVLPFAAYDQLPDDGLGGLHSKLIANLAAVLASRLRTAVAELNSLR